ncbi:MAG: helix-turn-helix transcriptional regulator [Pseudolabrys sp.]|nr:helix-turn-helix transcriptional regulator [Pseudolabrys sp.]
MQAHTGRQSALAAVIRQEQRIFATKLRATRAVLGWSQTDLAAHVGMTQRAIHKLEQGETEPRRATILAMAEVWRDQGLVFEDMPGGAFRLTVPVSVVEPGERRQGGRDHDVHTMPVPVYRA